jgi:germination protein M
MKKISLIILTLIFALSAFAGCKKPPGRLMTVNLYYPLTDSSELGMETREIEYAGAGALQAILNELLKPPVTPAFRRAIPEGTKTYSVTLDGEVATVNFSSGFNGDTDGMKRLSRGCVIKTLCAVDEVEKVQILIESEPMLRLSDGTPTGPLGEEDILLTSPAVNADRTMLSLYFADKDAMGLAREYRLVTLKEGATLEQTVVAEIIKGPQNKAFFRTLTEDTKLLSAETRDGVCFINFSSDFVAKNSGGSAKETMAIYSLVNSLCELPGVNKVQLLIEGRKIEVFGHMAINEPFGKDEGLITE